jgi:DNA-binding MarR family transcriptional regulator
LILLFWEAADAMIDELVTRIVAAGYRDIRTADSRVFGNLDSGGTRLIELAARARMTHQSMSELVSSLEARGYVERHQDPEDRRARLIRLSSTGRQVQRLAIREIAKIESTWLRWMGEDAGPNLDAALIRALESHSRSRRVRVTPPMAVDTVAE